MEEVTERKDDNMKKTRCEKRKKGKILWIVLAIIAGIILMAIVMIPKLLFPAYEEPVVTGMHQVQEELYTWQDESRVETFTDTGEKRALTVKFWYPKDEGSYPLVVFSHGAFGVIDSNYSTFTELASHGYVVASIAHPYHAMFVEDAAGKLTIADMDFVQQVYGNNGEYSEEAERALYEAEKEWMALRTADEHFVLDTILAKAENGELGPFSNINEEKIGLLGHSMGGASSVQLGRERDDIDAVIDLEGTMLGEYTGFENGFQIYNEEPYTVPVLDVNSKAVRDDIEALEKEHPGWQYVNDYLGENAIDYREVVFEGAGHLNFTDLPLISPFLAKMLGVGEVDAKECIENVNEMVLTYFDYYLKGIGSLEDIPKEY